MADLRGAGERGQTRYIHTHSRHLGHRRVEYLVFKHRPVVVYVMNLDGEVGRLLQVDVGLLVHDEGGKEVLNLLFPV